MNLHDIYGVTRTTGIVSPDGRKYVPASRGELQSILSRVISIATTGGVGQPQNQVHHEYVSFRLGPDLYYVDLLTADEDIRSRRLSDITELPHGDAS